MSPEQSAGEDVDGRSDVYSLGVVAFEMLAGRPPFSGNSLALIASHIKDTPPSLHAMRPELDAHFAELADRCLAKAGADRPAATEIAQALLPAAGAVIEWPPPGLEPLRGPGAVPPRIAPIESAL